MGELFRRFWMPILIADELEADGPPLRTKLLGEDLVAFRDSEGRIGVVDAYCAHRRSRLYYGRNEESGLRCIYPGWKFDVGGSCIDMPTEPADSTFKDRIHLKAYTARDWGGMVWVYMGPAELMPELQDLVRGRRFFGNVRRRAAVARAGRGPFPLRRSRLRRVQPDRLYGSHGRL